MQLLRIFALSLFAGCIGAGTVWYGWGLAENAASLLRTRRAASGTPAPEEDTGTETPKPEEAAS